MSHCNLKDFNFSRAENQLYFIGGSDNVVEVAKSLNKALHFNTYGGNPVACAVGSSVIDVSIFSFTDYLRIHNYVFVGY